MMIREAPAALPIHSPAENDPSFPDVGDPGKLGEFEEVLAVDQIQGNIVPGFNKDHQSVLVLEISHAASFKTWLKTLVPFVSSAAEVLAFNRLFKALRTRRGEPTGIKSTWVNIAFSHLGLQKLTDGTDLLDSDFTDEAFVEGMSRRAIGELGDPASDTEGNPDNWLLGGPNNDPADVILLVAADDRVDMLDEVARIEQTLYGLKDALGDPLFSGARVVFKEEGANLPGSLAGHEQFKTLDGISQPGLRGRVSHHRHDVLTPRQNPFDRGQGKPGQDLLWPGEFVFGYPAQNPNADRLEESKGGVREAGPAWAVNGSYLVFRRLRQDVTGFHTFLNSTGNNLGISPRQVSAKLVGRWPSGAPTVRTPDQDNGALGSDDCANNDYEFNPDPKTRLPAGSVDCSSGFDNPPFFQDDAAGKRLPFSAHTRKAYPRNDKTPAGGPGGDTDKSEVDTQTHRLLRRGIPYGPVSLSTPDVPTVDPQFVDRGLHFFAYQTSIVGQFEFVTKNWVNNPDFSAEAASGNECPFQGTNVRPTGHDPVIGQSNGPGGDRTRTFWIRFTDASGKDVCQPLTTAKDWVIPTGGGYFFAPSIRALEESLTA